MGEIMSVVRGAKSKAVTGYWQEFYIHKGHCSLCGNRGWLDTTKTAITATGVNSGKRQFCICPNGQEFRAQNCNLDALISCY